MGRVYQNWRKGSGASGQKVWRIQVYGHGTFHQWFSGFVVHYFCWEIWQKTDASFRNIGHALPDHGLYHFALPEHRQVDLSGIRDCRTAPFLFRYLDVYPRKSAFLDGLSGGAGGAKFSEPESISDREGGELIGSLFFSLTFTKLSKFSKR